MAASVTTTAAPTELAPSDVLVVVPAYNEAASIADVVALLRANPYPFIVINDGSTDDTEAILTALGVPHVRLIRNLGIGGAVQTGYRYAVSHGYKVAVQFDGDGQHDVACIPDVVKPIASGEADLVVGSRFVNPDAGGFKSSAARRAGIRMLSRILLFACGKRICDVTSGFRAAGPAALALFARDYPVDYPEPESLAVAVRAGCRVAEVPVTMHERQGGSSSISGLKSVSYMVKVGLAILVRTTIGPGRASS